MPPAHASRGWWRAVTPPTPPVSTKCYCDKRISIKYAATWGGVWLPRTTFAVQTADCRVDSILMLRVFILAASRETSKPSIVDTSNTGCWMFMLFLLWQDLVQFNWRENREPNREQLTHYLFTSIAMKSWRHFLIHITILGFHGWKEFDPMPTQLNSIISHALKTLKRDPYSEHFCLYRKCSRGNLSQRDLLAIGKVKKIKIKN